MNALRRQILQVLKKYRDVVEVRPNVYDLGIAATEFQKVADELEELLAPGRITVGGEYVPHQICPKCDGRGVVQKHKPTSNLSDVEWETCDVCEGQKLIPMYKEHSVYECDRGKDSSLLSGSLV